MKIHSHQIPFLLIMVILTLSQLSSCRDIHRVSIKSTLKEPTSQSHSQFFPIPAPKESRNEGKSNYTVSHRKTPGGPNPLHNWSVSCFFLLSHTRSFAALISVYFSFFFLWCPFSSFFWFSLFRMYAWCWFIGTSMFGCIGTGQSLHMLDSIRQDEVSLF